MHKSKTVYSFEMARQSGVILLTAKQWPWSVLQVVTTSPDDFEATLGKCEARGGFVATHDHDRTFCIIHLCSGDQSGRYPDRKVITNSQESARRYLDALRDVMAQAAVWYYTNVIEPMKNH